MQAPPELAAQALASGLRQGPRRLLGQGLDVDLLQMVAALAVLTPVTAAAVFDVLVA